MPTPPYSACEYGLHANRAAHPAHQLLAIFLSTGWSEQETDDKPINKEFDCGTYISNHGDYLQ